MKNLFFYFYIRWLRYALSGYSASEARTEATTNVVRTADFRMTCSERS